MTSAIGIEIATSAVRVAVVAHRGGRDRLVGYGEAELAPGCVVDGGVVAADPVREALRAAAEMAGVRFSRGRRRPRARLSVSGLRAITRQLELPPLPENEVEAAARLAALEVIPFAPERSVVSVCRVPETPPERPTVLVDAAQRDLLEGLVGVATAAGFAVEAVEPAASALARALRSRDGRAAAGGRAAAPEPAGAAAIVAIGAELSTVVVVRAGAVRFVRTIPTGGAAVTRALASAGDLAPTRAEALKRRIGEVGDASDAAVAARATAVAASSPLLAEIRSSLVYYATLPDCGEIEAVTVVGGGAKLAGLIEQLGAQLQIPTAPCAALGDLVIGVGEPDAAALAAHGAVVVGLARTRGGERAPNLLPPEILQARRAAHTEALVATAAAALALAAAGAGTVRTLQAHAAEHAAAVIGAHVGRLEAQLPRYQAAADLAARAQHDAAMAAPLVSHEVNWPAVLADLSASTPPLVATTSLGGAAGTLVPGTGASASAASAPSSSRRLPASSSVIGTLQLSLAARTFSDFQSWFSAIEASKTFRVVQYSGLTGSGTGVDFSAVLDVTGSAHTSRLSQFEEPTR